MVAVNYLLNGDAFLAGTNGDGYTVFVRTANEEHITTFQSEIAHINVGWYIHTSQVANMDGTVGIGQCRSDGCPFKMLFHKSYVFDFGGQRYD